MLHVPQQSHRGAEGDNEVVAIEEVLVIAAEQAEEHGHEGFPSSSAHELDDGRRRRILVHSLSEGVGEVVLQGLSLVVAQARDTDANEGGSHSSLLLRGLRPRRDSSSFDFSVVHEMRGCLATLPEALGVMTGSLRRAAADLGSDRWRK